MAFKNISLSVEAYERLRKMKKNGESFSDEVIRLTSSEKLSDLAGIFTEQEAEELEKNVGEVKKSFEVKPWSF